MHNEDNLEFALVKCSDKLMSIFGYWPEFCDAKIKSLVFSKSSIDGDSIQFLISYIDSSLSLKAVISLIFKEVENLNLSDLMNENVLDELLIQTSSTNSMYIDVELVSCYGLCGSFICRSVELLDVNSGIVDRP